MSFSNDDFLLQVELFDFYDFGENFLGIGLLVCNGLKQSDFKESMVESKSDSGWKEFDICSS